MSTRRESAGATDVPTFFKPPKSEWTETKGKREVRRRSFGRCEVRTEVCTAKHEHTHHIKRRGQGGTWDPENLLGVCHACHDWIHDHIDEARAAGWLAPKGT